jgi:anti-sigma28 factor (negative regulator of flagellin synthesis)
VKRLRETELEGEAKMQISNDQVQRVLEQAREQRRQLRSEPPVNSVDDLAARHGVNMDEVRRMKDKMMLSGDVSRERRVEALARSVEAGEYHISAEAVVDMAKRRAIADCSGSL